jgi:hypothetical protein
VELALLGHGGEQKTGEEEKKKMTGIRRKRKQRQLLHTRQKTLEMATRPATCPRAGNVAKREDGHGEANSCSSS